jgi:hypothetical protein
MNNVPVASFVPSLEFPVGAVVHRTLDEALNALACKGLLVASLRDASSLAPLCAAPVRMRSAAHAVRGFIAPSGAGYIAVLA